MYIRVWIPLVGVAPRGIGSSTSLLVHNGGIRPGGLNLLITKRINRPLLIVTNVQSQITSIPKISITGIRSDCVLKMQQDPDFETNIGNSNVNPLFIGLASGFGMQGIRVFVFSFSVENHPKLITFRITFLFFCGYCLFNQLNRGVFICFTHWRKTSPRKTGFNVLCKVVRLCFFSLTKNMKPRF